MSAKLIFRIYLVFYIAAALLLLAGAWIDGGYRRFLLLLCFMLIVSIYVGPLLFYKVLNKLDVWIPRVGWYGPKSSEESRFLYSVVVGSTPFIFILIFVFSY